MALCGVPPLKKSQSKKKPKFSQLYNDQRAWRGIERRQDENFKPRLQIDASSSRRAGAPDDAPPHPRGAPSDAPSTSTSTGAAAAPAAAGNSHAASNPGSWGGESPEREHVSALLVPEQRLVLPNQTASSQQSDAEKVNVRCDKLGS